MENEEMKALFSRLNTEKMKSDRIKNFYGTLNREKSTLEKWAKCLKIFSYIAGVGGHANIPDELVLGLKFANVDEITKFIDTHKIYYAETEFNKTNIVLSNYGESKDCKSGEYIFYGQLVYIRFSNTNYMEILINRDYTVSDEDIEKAKIVEKDLVKYSLNIYNPIDYGDRRLSPENYPELYQ